MQNSRYLGDLQRRMSVQQGIFYAREAGCTVEYQGEDAVIIRHPFLDCAVRMDLSRPTVTREFVTALRLLIARRRSTDLCGDHAA